MGEDSDRHIVDQLIRERAPGLSGGLAWPVVRPPLYKLLNYAEARDMADTIKDMDGREALEHASDLLDLQVSAEAVDCVPGDGACLIVVNHPTGIADGVAVHDALIERRPDLCFFVNADALRICEGLEQVAVPVVWPPEERDLESSKETLRQAVDAIENERAIVIFPSGAVARKRKREGEVRDEPWEATPVTLARKHDVTIVPCHLSGPESRLFHLFDTVSEELRDVTLFHEMLNKKGDRFKLVFGEPMEPDALEDLDDQETTDSLRRFVNEDLAGRPGGRFDPG